MATLTVANSSFFITLPDLFAAPVQIQGYATDDAFTTESVKPADTLMGVDGTLSGGYVPTEKPMVVTLQADSPSNSIFEAWFQGQETQLEAFTASASITIPGISRVYTFTNGFLTGYMPTPDAKKILQPRRFQITWQGIIAANI